MGVRSGAVADGGGEAVAFPPDGHGHGVRAVTMNAPSPAFPIEIANVRKNARESIVVRLCQFEGRSFGDIRITDIPSGSMPRMTKRGVTINPRKFGELIAALQEAERQAAALGLLADGGGR